MTNYPQTGETPIQDYSQALLRQWQRTGERYGLGTVEMEELTQLASTETVTHSQNTYHRLETLMAGLEALPWTMNDPALLDQLRMNVLYALPGIRDAVVLRRPGKPVVVRAYLTRL